MSRFLIIGRGVAGISAGLAIRTQDQTSDLLLIGAEEAGYYSRPGLAYYLTGEINEKMLYPFSAQELHHKNLPQMHAQVKAIHAQNHQVELVDGSIITYERLLLATGASASRPALEGIHLNGAVTLDSLDDAKRILKLARSARAAVVVGGGITALELVEGLRARGLSTHYLLRRDRYWGNVLDERESRIVEQRLQDEGITIHYQTEIAEILGRRNRVSGVRTTAGREIRCQLVAIAIGIKPRTELAVDAGLQVDRGILVDEQLRTSESDIFAAGDVAQVFDPLSGKSIVDSLWGPARQQGWIAGLNMTGKNIAYEKGVPFNVTRLAGLTTTIIGSVGRGQDPDLIGIARGDSESWRLMPDSIAVGDDFEVNRIRLTVGEKTLLGAILMGDQTLSRVLQELISNQADISQIRAQLLQSGAPIADLILNFWKSWKIDHAANQS